MPIDVCKDSDPRNTGSIGNYDSDQESDTEYETDAASDFDPEDFSKYVDKKHLKRYYETNCFTTIVPIVDRREVKKETKTHVVVISHKYDPKYKQVLKRYCSESASWKDYCDEFKGFYYPYLKTFINWPKQKTTNSDHKPDSPYYSVTSCQSKITTPYKPQKFYNLFGFKSRYHRLFTPARQVKFFCPPEEQQQVVFEDSSPLFSNKEKVKPIRYKYDFLNSSDVLTNSTNVALHYDSDLDPCSSLSSDSYSESECESDATVIYDTKSYNFSSRNFEDETDPFVEQVSEMNHKIKVEHGDGLRQLVSSDLSDLVDDFDLDLALKKCHEEGDWNDKSFIENKFSLQNRPLDFSNSTRTKTLKSALSTLENRKMETVYKLNQQFKMVKQLCFNFLKTFRTIQKNSERNKYKGNLEITFHSGKKLPRKVAMHVSKLQNELHSTSDKDENLEPNSAEIDSAESSSSNDKRMSIHPSSDVKQEDRDIDIIFPDLFKKHQCKICGKKYTDKRSFQCHIQSHS